MKDASHAPSLLRILFYLAVRMYPVRYRARFADEMLLVFLEGYAAVRKDGSLLRRLRFFGRELRGLTVTALRERLMCSRDLMAAHRDTVLISACVFVAVFAGYAWTLAPTVTFWDAGEFLAASKTLGVPHPPGTPLFVLVSNVWARLVPFGDYAYKVNLLTAVFSATAAVFFALIVFKVLRASEGRVVAYVGGVSAALVSAFSFTVWQNSNETEVYMTAAVIVAATCFLALQWRAVRETGRAPKILLVILYLAALSVGNHLMALLVGPALMTFMWFTMTTSRVADLSERRREFAVWLLFSAAWVGLIGIGLGSAALSKVTGVLFLFAVVNAIRVGAWRMSIATTCVAIAGVSTYLFLYIRAGFDPFLNEADPSTWDALIAVIQRAQYPVRLPTDNPLYLTGPENPGRTLDMLWLQVINYVQYFDWQWSRGLASARQLFALERLPFTLGYLSLGLVGLRLLWKADRAVFWMLLLVFVVTGPGLVLYMNFKPGFSIGYDVYPEFGMHEVRERDYFFVISFQVWGVLAGVGIVRMFSTFQRWLNEYFAPKRAMQLACISFVAAVFPLVMNFPVASRAHGADATLAREFGRDLLKTVEPYGVLFTNGDNDTFPLWYQQAVESFRPDVTVVVMSLSASDWFIKQLRDRPTAPFIPEQAPWFTAPSYHPTSPLLTWSDEDISGLRPWIVLQEDLSFRAGNLETVFPAGTALLRQDMVALRLIHENAGRRPIYLSTTAGSGGASWERLGDSLVQEGLALRLYVEDDSETLGLPPGAFGVPVDVERTEILVNHAYSFGDLFAVDSLQLDSTSQRIAGNLAAPFLSLAQAHLSTGDSDSGLSYLRSAYHLAPSRQLAEVMARLTP